MASPDCRHRCRASGTATRNKSHVHRDARESSARRSKGVSVVMARVKGFFEWLRDLRLPKPPSLGAITAPLLLGLGFILLAAFVIILRDLQTPSVSGREVAYSQVLDYANEHRVAEATLLSEDGMVQAKLRNGQLVYS